MRPIRSIHVLLPAAFLSISLAFSPARAGEVTYGETKSVPKESPSSREQNGDGGSRESCDRDDDDDVDSDRDEGGGAFLSFQSKGKPGLARACFSMEMHPNSLGEVFGGIIMMPLWWGVCSAGYGVGFSHVHLAVGNKETEAVPEGRWRFSGGFGVDWDWLARTADGPGTGGHLEATGPLASGANGRLDLRMRTAPSASALAMSVDYERAVFVDGSFKGMQRDVMSGYSQLRIPVTAELLWQPGLRGLYLGAGAGGMLLKEVIEFERVGVFSSHGETMSEDRGILLPMATAVLGRNGLDGSGRPRWYFEIRYQALFHRPDRASSFPADNAALSHALGWEWGWYW